MTNIGCPLGLARRVFQAGFPRRKSITTQLIKWPFLCAVLALTAGCGLPGSHPAVPRPSADISFSPPPPPQKWDLPVSDHPAVETFVRRFSEKNHSSFQIQLDRSYYYAAPAKKIFESQGLPKDLIYVALVESGFSPKARSHAKAVGMWQFIPKTGDRFGLKQDKWVDERCHPVKSAKAAADYLSFLYDAFGSWPLALAAYNAGENAVHAALDKSGLKTFWELLDNGYLPAETRDYVPKVYAAVKIVRNSVFYGFQFDPERYIAKHETVPVPGGVKLSAIGKQIGVPEDSLRDCNPELCQSTTPPGCSDYELCVPMGKGEDLMTFLARHPPQEEEKPQPGHVASRARAVAHAKTAARVETVARAQTVARAKTMERAQPPAQSYRARPGDSCLSLAKKYKCSAKEFAALNGIKPGQPLKPGQVFKLPAKSVAVAAASPVKNGKGAAPNAGRKKLPPLGKGKKTQGSYS